VIVDGARDITPSPVRGYRITASHGSIPQVSRLIPSLTATVAYADQLKKSLCR